jgi:autotransporter-associated beta strand protein
VNLATTTGGDYFNLGYLTPGVASGVLHVGGPGTIYLNQATASLGSWILDAGALQIGDPTALGAGEKTLRFGPGSTATFQLASQNLLASGLVTDATPGTTVVENNGFSPSLLTISNLVNNTFAGTLRDGTNGGTLGLIKEGTASLNLTGASTFTGNTVINFGRLAVNNTSGSGLGSGAVTVTDGATLAGNGAVSGAVQVQANGILSPGNTGVGTNKVGALTMDAGSFYNFEFNGTANDRTVVTTSGGLTINGGAFNVYQEGGVSGYTAPGTYNLIQYSGAIGGTGLDSSWTTASGANPHVANPQAGLFYAYGTSGGNLQLLITVDPAAVFGTWTNDVDGVWTTAANWSSNPNFPKLAKNSATFGTGTALRTVTLNASLTNGSVTFNNNNSFVIADGGSKVLNLDNDGAPVVVAVSGGTQNVIQPAVSLKDNATLNVNSTKSLTIAGTISNTAASKTLTLNGAGTVTLTGNNSYGPAAGSLGTALNGGGILQVGHGKALGAGDVSITAASATLKAGAAGLTVSNNLSIATLLTGTVDNNGNDLTLAGIIAGNGSLVKIGNGTLTLNGNNTLAGKTTVNAGILSLSADANLGTVPGSPTVSQIRLDGGALLGTATFNVSANRGLGVGPVAGTAGTNALLNAATGQEFRLDGIIATAGNTGTNGLIVNSLTPSPGKVILGAANTFNGPTVIANGTLQLAATLALQNSSLNYNTGTLLFDGAINAATLAGIDCTNFNQVLTLANQGGGSVALTVGGNNASTTFAGTMTGLGSLTKAGSGNLTILGTNNYTGATVVNGGQLIITNGGVINGGALGGSGNIRVAGGFLGSVGTLTFGNGANPYTQTDGTSVLDTLHLSNNDGNLISVLGGSMTVTNVTMRRTRANTTAPTFTAPLAAVTTAGLYVTGTVTTVNIINTLVVGNTLGNSSAESRIDGGTVTVNGVTTVGNLSGGGRWNILQLNGGRFISTETTQGIVLSPNTGTTVANNSELYVSGGTNTVEKICFGLTTDVVNGGGWLIINEANTSALGSNAVLYVGSGGIVQSNLNGFVNTFTTNIVPNVSTNITTNYIYYAANISLMKGTLGAKADWSTTNDVRLSVTNFTIKAADIANVPHNITLAGILSGPGNLNKTGNGTLTLGGDNLSSGTTTNAAGTLALTGNAQITNSPLIVLQGSSVLDVSGRVGGTLNLGVSRSQSLQGTGTITGALAAGPLATVAPGFSIGTLTVSGNVTLAGNTVMELDRSATPKSDKIVAASIAAGGTLTVTNIGAALQGGDTFQLFSTPVTGAFAVTNLPALPGGMIWSNSLAANGSLTVVATVNTSPFTLTNTVSGNVLTLAWPVDHTGYRLQVQTNTLATGLRTNWVDVPNSTAVNTTNFTINPANGSVFYRLIYP